VTKEFTDPSVARLLTLRNRLESEDALSIVKRERNAYATALREIAQGEVSGFELQQIAIRALAGDYRGT
jgi:hypothetical protein